MPRAKRAALLPTPGDPFVLSYALTNHVEMWAEDVDELHVFVNGNLSPEAWAADREMVEAVGGKLYGFSSPIGHGPALQHLLRECDAAKIMLIEDDAYVRVRGSVSDAFERIPAGGVIGSPRGGYDPAIEPAAQAKWGDDPQSPDSHSGWGLWPCFLFGDRSTLEPAACGFPSLAWGPGMTIPGLELTVPLDRSYTTDTCTLAALILRASGPVLAEGQWKELWLKNLDERRDFCGYEPPWFHSGGLSNQMEHSGPPIGGTNAGLDVAHRVWWWRRTIEMAPELLCPSLATSHLAKLDALVHDAGIAEQVEAWDDTLEPWITWNEGA